MTTLLPPVGAVLVVDVANVVGSRPDGWWRDRRGAAERLLHRVARLTGEPVSGPDGAPLQLREVHAVVEGAARAAEGPASVVVCRAAGPGDDEVVRVAERAAARGVVVVVTADRDLRARLPSAAVVAGPTWLLGLLAG